MDMQKEIKKYEEARNKVYDKYPKSYSEFSYEKLKEFDETQIGSLKELSEKKESYKKQLLEEYNELQKQKRAEYNALDKQFREELYQESYAKDFNNGRKIFNRLYAIAYERGHSCGMQEIVNEFDELDSNFSELVDLMNEK